MLDRLKPLQLTKIALGAAFLAALPAMLSDVPQSWLEASGLTGRRVSIVAIVFAIALFLGGMIVDGLAELKLRNGKAAGVWTDEELAECSRWMARPIMIRLNLAMVLGYLVALVFIRMTGHHAGSLGMTIWPSLALSRLITNSRPAKPTRLREPQEPAAPLYSQHWGQSA